MVNDPFRALSHPIRRGIVERLAEGPATVGEATAGFGVSKPAISKHLKVLEETGVVKRVVEGRTHRSRSSPTRSAEAVDWMDRQRALWVRMFDVVDEYLKEEQRNEHTPDRLPRGVEGSAREAAGEGEGAHPRPRRARRRAPADAVDGGREGVLASRARMAPRACRPLRGPPPADRLPRLLRAGGDDLRRGRLLPGARLRGLLVRRRPGRAPRPPERPRHLARVRLARPPGRDPGPEGAARLGADPVVHDPRRLRFDSDFDVARVARHQRLHPRGRADLPHLLHRRSRRRGRWATPGTTST